MDADTPRRPWHRRKRAWAALALWLVLPVAYVGAYLALARPGLWLIAGGRINAREVEYPHPALRPIFKPAEWLDPRLRPAPSWPPSF